MIAFWIAAALLSALTAGFVLYRAAWSARAAAAGEEDPAIAVYRRQLAELDDLADRDLLPPAERRSARAEAARRLLGAADAASGRGVSPSVGRVWIAALAGATPLIAVVIYLAVGSPQAPDAPFARRVASWRAADPASLGAAQMAAVLRGVVAQRPGDDQALAYLGRAQLAAGDGFSAERSLKAAIRMRPLNAGYWMVLGDILATEAKGVISDDAQAAYRRALALQPGAPGPRYYLAKARIEGGDRVGGAADLRALAGDLAADDPRKPALSQEIDGVEHGDAAPARGAAPDITAPPQQAFIRAMVASLAARLAATPDDPAGWGRLVRSYGVLGDTAHGDEAAARARALFKDRPDAWRTFQDAMAGRS